MPKEEWSAETQRLRATVTESLDLLARSMEKDREGWGRYEDLSDEDKVRNSLDGKQPTAWVTIVQFQGFDDPEMTNVVHCNSGGTAATNKGLATYAAERY